MLSANSWLAVRMQLNNAKIVPQDVPIALKLMFRHAASHSHNFRIRIHHKHKYDATYGLVEFATPMQCFWVKGCNMKCSKLFVVQRVHDP